MQIPVYAQQDEVIYDLDEEIIVTASQIPTAFSNVARSVAVLNAREIARLPVQNIQDAIDYLAGIDMQQRGPQGVQADVSIRGATFEQTLVLIDGVKISDAQTGHHNMNIPLSLADIEKIEVLKGPASRHFGPNAFGGVINIITKHQDKTGLSASVTGGQNNFYDVAATMHMQLGKISNRFSVQKSASDGYRPNTDFSALTASLASNLALNTQNKINFLAAFNDKEFGANSFYSVRFPDQWEHTSTLFMKSAWNYKSDNFQAQARVHYRLNDDEFLLNRDQPAFYKNEHQNNTIGADLQFGLNSVWGISSMGIELSRESINSSNLGRHQRDKSGMFVEHQLQLHEWRLVLAGSLYQISDWGWNAWPGFDLRYTFNPNLYFYTSVGRAFRVPTYTEMYYNDPVNQGNPGLREEKGWVFEVGTGLKAGDFQVNLAGFQRNGQNLIDWIWSENDSIWQVQNLGALITRGLETQISFLPQFRGGLSFLKRVSLGYTYLDSDRDLGGAVSKYALSYLKHQLQFGIGHNLFYPQIYLLWKFRYEHRLMYQDRLLSDMRINWKHKQWSLNLDITNITNQKYEDYFDVHLPGRWLKFGVQFSTL